MNERTSLRFTTQRARTLDLLLRTRQFDFRGILNEQTHALLRNPPPRHHVVLTQDRFRRYLIVGEELIRGLEFISPVHRRRNAHMWLSTQSIDDDRKSFVQPLIAQFDTSHFSGNR